eukprot:7148000-Heterocapsa_arctica.AAC.1
MCVASIWLFAFTDLRIGFVIQQNSSNAATIKCFLSMCNKNTPFYDAWNWVPSAEAWADHSNRLHGVLGGDPIYVGSVSSRMKQM